MSVYAGPNVIQNGLVLHLDAGNSRSYSGTGTAWNDISGNRNNGTLTNGPAFSDINGGNIVFDGNNDYCDFLAAGLSTVATVEMWVRLGASYSGKMFFGWLTYSVWCDGNKIGYNTGAVDLYGISSLTASSLGLVNNWKHYIFEMRNDVSYTNNKIYINTISQSLSQQQGSENASNRNFNNGNGRISGWRNDLDYHIPMNCSLFKVYNRILSTSEILQNYNATRGRFNL